MKHSLLAIWIIVVAAPFLAAQEVSLTEEENAAVAAILAKAQEEPEQKPQDRLPLPQAARLEVKNEIEQQEAAEEGESPQKCLTVAFIDIDEVFNAHPRTIAVKEQIRRKILAKEEEVAGAKQLIEILTEENRRLGGLMRQLKPFYEYIATDPRELQPRPTENADALAFGNMLNRLTFAGTDVFYTTPLNIPAQLEDLKTRIISNKKIIGERAFFIDNYRYTTREEILKLEEQEVKEILKDIYLEIKSFAKKRNIGAVVRKEEILYGEHPVNVTKDFLNRLKKAKKYRTRGK